MPQITVPLSQDDVRNWCVLDKAGVDIAAVCREAIAAKAQQVDLGTAGFARGDYVRVTMAGPYQDALGTVLGHWQSMITVFLASREVMMFLPQELKHREEDTCPP